MARDNDRYGREENQERGRTPMRHRNEQENEEFRSREGSNPPRGGQEFDEHEREGRRGEYEPQYGRGGYGEGRGQGDRQDWNQGERQGRGEQRGWSAREQREWGGERERGGWRDRERGYSGGGYVPGGVAGSGNQGYWNQGGHQGSGSQGFGNQGIGNQGWGSGGDYWTQQNQQGFGLQPGYGGEQGMRSDLGSRGGRPFEKDWDRSESRERSGSGKYSGMGPSGYRRSDDRIREDVNDRLTEHPWINATGIEVTVEGCEVTLAGEVENRDEKRMAEDAAESVPGVKDVHNKIKTRRGLMGRLFGGGGHVKKEEVRRGMTVEDADHRQVGTVRDMNDREVTIQRETGDAIVLRFEDFKEVKNDRLCLDRRIEELEQRTPEEVGGGNRRTRTSRM